jgi:hypothetical protein
VKFNGIKKFVGCRTAPEFVTEEQLIEHLGDVQSTDMALEKKLYRGRIKSIKAHYKTLKEIECLLHGIVD